MYLEHFKLGVQPFGVTPHTRFLYLIHISVTQVPQQRNRGNQRPTLAASTNRVSRGKHSRIVELSKDVPFGPASQGDES